MIGDLNKRIEIQAPTRVSDGMGSFTETWSTIATVFCALWPLSATETVQSMQTGMTISHRIRVRWRSVLRPSWRLKFGQRYFNIVSILNPGERNEYLDILAKEAT
uniref:Putative head-tail joining protein n=1 Tax=viral metagenome TaxID=1070528 RepID=A0A6H1ZBS3_9ZZZZ